ncbi:MAG: response regulator transcription factor [Adhaeribacter sp.]
MKILVIEDEPDMRQNIVDYLSRERYLVETAPTFETAWEKIHLYAYDCILLDITLPDGNGLDLLQAMKNQGKAQSVIILSARDSLDDKITGLEAGADDYLPKPFHLAELQARLKSVLRRHKFEGQAVLQVANLQIDPDRHQVWVADRELGLNRKEFDILVFLASNKGRMISKTALAEHVWGDYIDEADDFEFIYSQIKNLRKKLRDSQARVEIQAVYGMGYKLLAE